MDTGNTWYFVSDLHGSASRFRSLQSLLESSPPHCLFVGGDILPSGRRTFTGDHTYNCFFHDLLYPMLRSLRSNLGDRFPLIYMILGNDDERTAEQLLIDGETEGLLIYLHNRKHRFGIYTVYGYSCVPPTPFMLKDWERYDVSRYVDPLCIHPAEGRHTVPLSNYEINHGTIQDDLASLVGDDPINDAVLLFHTPPHMTNLDRADIAGVMVDHVPLDPHVGSIAVRRFIEDRQPRITLHGHIHESARLSGSWRDNIGGTAMFSAAHDGPELAVVVFDPEHPEGARRILL